MAKKQHVVKATVYDKRGTIIGQAVNNYRKSHPIQAHFAHLAGEDHRIYLHAEIAALLKCGTRRPHRIFISRVTNEGPKLAAPCPVCRLAIEHWGVKEVTYT